MSVNTINRKKTYTQKLFGDPAGEVLVREKSGDSSWSEWVTPFVPVDLTNVDKKQYRKKSVFMNRSIPTIRMPPAAL